MNFESPAKIFFVVRRKKKRYNKSRSILKILTKKKLRWEKLEQERTKQYTGQKTSGD
jgi:hypothetical protein